jgi:hypothetical protein
MSGVTDAGYAGSMQIPRRTFQQGGVDDEPSSPALDEPSSAPLLLIVEDDGSVRHLLAKALSAAFTVKTARDGHEGSGSRSCFVRRSCSATSTCRA